RGHMMARNKPGHTPALKQKSVSPDSSPYTVQNLDAAITHLERVLCGDSLTIFGVAYWRARIRQIEATPALLHTQLCRLRLLQERLPDAPSDATAHTAQAPRQETRDSHRSGDLHVLSINPGTRPSPLLRGLSENRTHRSS
ncbi:MAG TPA: hypothetical protein VJU59_44295, partial [Paraburkholderia sp.]|uniref:hypothetical protein n=1 Tax=Paraburkholderia sp. TaxID=1926495 RepID=UPI002B482843